MKKNKMMRIASALLIAVLLTTCAISGTFAKYTTKGDFTDSARVAKFGVEVVAGGNLFAENYDDTVVSAGAVTIGEGSYKKLVAPGTDGAMTSFAITGSPEVDVKVTYEATVTLSVWEVDGDYYCPLVVYVNDNPIYGAGCTSEADFAGKIKAAIDAYTASYEANDDLANVETDATKLSVRWEWPFETGNDVKDTKLGDADELATIDIKVTCTVTQID